MEEIPGFVRNSDLVGYSRDLAVNLHKDAKRDSGAPYADHLRAVAGFAEGFLRPSRFKPAGISTSWLHDAPEDTPGIRVFNPFRPPVDAENNAVYLNSLLKEAGDEGAWMCYMIDRLTRRGENYFDYMMRKFSISRDRAKRILDRISLAIKIADRTSNSIPDEEIDPNKKISNALDNLTLYLPKGERYVLAGIGSVNRHFEESKALNDPYFNYGKLRQLFGQCYRQSLQILDGLMPLSQAEGPWVKIIKRTGYNRGNQTIPGYVPVI